LDPHAGIGRGAAFRGDIHFEQRQGPEHAENEDREHHRDPRTRIHDGGGENKKKGHEENVGVISWLFRVNQRINVHEHHKGNDRIQKGKLLCDGDETKDVGEHNQGGDLPIGAEPRIEAFAEGH